MAENPGVLVAMSGPSVTVDYPEVNAEGGDLGNEMVERWGIYPSSCSWAIVFSQQKFHPRSFPLS